MATSGSTSVVATKTSSGNTADTLKFSWTAGAQSLANNTTPVNWKLELISGAYGKISSSASKKWSVTVNGSNYNGTNTVGIGNNSTKTLASGSTTIAHNDDGTKSFSYSFSQQFDISFNGSVGTVSGSGSGTLDTIARASQPSCITWPEHTQNVGNFGDTISIHMNRKSDSFTHTVRYAYGDLSGTIATNVSTGTTWKIPLSFMDKIPNDTKGSGTIYVDTYSGSTKVGTKSCGFTATVPTSVKPSVTATLTDTTGVDGLYGSPVVGLSKIKVTPSVTLAYSSPIKTYSITIDGVTYSSNSVTTGFLQNRGASPVTVTVTDARGRTDSWSYPMTVQDYTRPQVSTLAVHRTNGDWTENDQGNHVMVTVTATINPMGEKNLADYTLRYKKTTEDTWSTIDLSEVDHNFNLYNYAVLFAADVSSSYDVEFTAADRHHTTIRSTSASTAFSLMDWHSTGTGIAFGKVAEHERMMDVALALRLSGGIAPIDLVEGDDLNADKYKTSGWYRCPLSATAEKLVNSPTDKAFVMEVLPNIPATQRITEYVQDATPRIFVRNYYDHLDTWGLWHELVPRQAQIGTKVSLISLAADATYTFPSDGYLVLRAHYSTGAFVNCTLSGSNGKGFLLTATSGAAANLKGNPTDALFVRKGMIVSAVTTSSTSQNALEFHPLY